MKETPYPLDKYAAKVFYIILECVEGILVNRRK